MQGNIYIKKEKTNIIIKLTKLKNNKLNKLSLTNKNITNNIKIYLKKNIFYVSSKEQKKIKRDPLPPFTTSTLQQEAATKLGFSAKKTMKLAQELYEGINIGKNETKGLITYIRTDSVSISSPALSLCRKTIKKLYGENYLSSHLITYKAKSINSQESHEAIRPTDFNITIKKLKKKVTKDKIQLYNLIWNKSLSSQMSKNIVNEFSIEISNNSKMNSFFASGLEMNFKGFLIIEKNTQINKKHNTIKSLNEKILNDINHSEKLSINKIDFKQYTTAPPPRYNEATLIKTLEMIGIGRPSTYETISSTLQIRKYVKIEKHYFWIESKGRIVNSFLTNFFNQYIAYHFTVTLENKLDNISNGKLNWKTVLNQFWKNFKIRVNKISKVSNSNIINRLNKELLNIFIKEKKCYICKKGLLSLKRGKFGIFVGCSKYPKCNMAQKIYHHQKKQNNNNLIKHQIKFQLIGNNPITGRSITLRNGPYGLYLQCGNKKKGVTSKCINIPETYKKNQITLKSAIELNNLPKILGIEQNNGKYIYAGLGRFGPYTKIGNIFISINKTEDILNISFKKVLEIHNNLDRKTS